LGKIDYILVYDSDFLGIISLTGCTVIGPCLYCCPNPTALDSRYFSAWIDCGCMSKDPAVLFFTSDFLAGTSFFTYEQRGQYITLLCEQHQLYSIPEDHIILVCGSLDSPVAKKFIRDNDGTYYQHRMREESEKRKSFCESRRKSIEQRYVRTTHEDHTKVRMGNGNGNGNDNEIKDEIEITVDRIYNLYPTRDINNGNRSTGKTHKDKDTIRKIITDNPNNCLEKLMIAYIKDAAEHKSFLKNLKSFLSQKPETPPEEQPEHPYERLA
jgi:hypothetical protein